MREIKFRFWNGKKMDYKDEDVSIWNGMLVCEGDTIPMQFTGLKDKNGKEIYEGDILEHRDTFYPDINAPRRFRVEYVLEPFGGYCAMREDGPEKLVARLFDDDGYATEVIGNIYETPGLLKE